jgi:hypothetical protein
MHDLQTVQAVLQLLQQQQCSYCTVCCRVHVAVDQSYMRFRFHSDYCVHNLIVYAKPLQRVQSLSKQCDRAVQTL